MTMVSEHLPAQLIAAAGLSTRRSKPFATQARRVGKSLRK